MYTPNTKASDSMDKRERFIVKSIYGANWQDWLDPYNKNVMESDRERAQRIKAMQPAYYVVTMRTSLKWYEYKPNGMSWDEYHRTIKSQKPKLMMLLKISKNNLTQLAISLLFLSLLKEKFIVTLFGK